MANFVKMILMFVSLCSLSKCKLLSAIARKTVKLLLVLLVVGLNANNNTKTQLTIYKGRGDDLPKWCISRYGNNEPG